MIRFEARDGFPGNASLGEGPVWHRGALYWVDILNGAVFRSGDTGTALVAETEGTVSKALPRKEAGFVLLTETSVELVDSYFNFIERIEILPKGSDTRLSDGTVGPAGELWFGSMRNDMSSGGTLYRLRPGEQEATPILKNLGMPNGIAFAPDHKHMYFVDSIQKTITAYSYDKDTQHVHSPFVLTTIDVEAFGTPDGITVDEAGAIWVAHFAGGAVRRLELDGSWSQEILTPAQNVTSCVFGGDKLQTLFITSATVELTPEELCEQPGAGSVFAITLPIGGVHTLEAAL